MKSANILNSTVVISFFWILFIIDSFLSSFKLNCGIFFPKNEVHSCSKSIDDAFLFFSIFQFTFISHLLFFCRIRILSPLSGLVNSQYTKTHMFICSKYTRFFLFFLIFNLFYSYTQSSVAIKRNRQFVRMCAIISDTKKVKCQRSWLQLFRFFLERKRTVCPFKAYD